jgi:hypothetical protein
MFGGAIKLPAASGRGIKNHIIPIFIMVTFIPQLSLWLPKLLMGIA